MRWLLTLGYCGLLCGDVVAAELIVPSSSFPTIQSAINAAGPSDYVTVLPGSYPETIDFRGKAIAVRSRQGRDQTFIQAARLLSGEGGASLLEGFTIGPLQRPGCGTGRFLRIGVDCFNASPTIRSNRIRWMDTGIPYKLRWESIQRGAGSC